MCACNHIHVCTCAFIQMVACAYMRLSSYVSVCQCGVCPCVHTSMCARLPPHGWVGRSVGRCASTCAWTRLHVSICVCVLRGEHPYPNQHCESPLQRHLAMPFLIGIHQTVLLDEGESHAGRCYGEGESKSEPVLSFKKPWGCTAAGLENCATYNVAGRRQARAGSRRRLVVGRWHIAPKWSATDSI